MLLDVQVARGGGDLVVAHQAADFAGIAFARKLRSDARAVPRLSVLFDVKDYVPDVTVLPEGLSKERFQADYGSESDPRFRKVLDDVRKRVNELPGFKN